MKISEYIEELQKLQKEHGDLEMQSTDRSGERHEAPLPRLDYAAILQGREYKPKFHTDIYDPSKERKGGPVIRVS